jgi:hypothetical protein
MRQRLGLGWVLLALEVAAGCSEADPGGSGAGGGASGAESQMSGNGSGGGGAGKSGAAHGGDGRGGSSGDGHSAGESGMGGAHAGQAGGGGAHAGQCAEGGAAGTGEAAVGGALAGGAGEAGGGQGGESGDCAPVPPVELGPDDCLTDAQCQTGQTCESATTAKLCIPVGQGCDEPEHCPEGQTCSAHKCVEAAPLGSPCSAGNRCKSGVRCGYDYVYQDEFSGFVETGPLQCRAPIGSTEPCDIHQTYDERGGCAADLVCSINRLLDPGEPFEYCFPRGGFDPYFSCPNGDGDCLPGFLCGESTGELYEPHCYPVLTLGEECDVDPDFHCGEQLRCVANDPEDPFTSHCQPLPAACEACGKGEDNAKALVCESGSYCKDDKCRAKPTLGQPCDSAPCAEGFACVTAHVDGSCH